MKKGKLVAVGLVPLALGAVLHAIVLARPDTIPPVFWIGVGFLLLWGVLGYLLCGWGDSKIEVTAYAHLIGGIFLLLILFQEIVLGHYLSNALGLVTQSYFLLLLNVSFWLAPWAGYVWAVNIVALVLMIGAFYLGCHIKKK